MKPGEAGDNPSAPREAAPAGAQEILRRRARELAREIAPPEEGERLRIVVFRLGRERLAFESAWVREVFIPRGIVPVPGTPPFVAGIVNLRGAILSILDLRRVLALPPGEEKMGVVLHLCSEEMEFGVLADRVEASREIPRRDLAPPPATLDEAALRFLRGLLPGSVSLLDARFLLTAAQLRVEQRRGADPAKDLP